MYTYPHDTIIDTNDIRFNLQCEIWKNRAKKLDGQKKKALVLTLVKFHPAGLLL